MNLFLAWHLSLKRLLSAPLLWLSLAALTLAVAASALVGTRAVRPSCGYACTTPGGELTAAVKGELTAADFLPYDSPDALRRAVSDGDVDCGVLLGSGLETGIRSGNLGAAVTMIASGTSSFTAFYAGIAGSVLFNNAVPYLSAAVLAGLGIDNALSLTAEAYRALLQDGSLFTFRTETLEGGQTVLPAAYADGLVRAALALLLFAALTAETFRACRQDMCRFRPVMGTRAVLTRVLLPELLLRGLLFYAAAAAGLLLGSRFSGTDLTGLLLPLAAFLLLLTALGILLSATLPRSFDLRLALPLWLLVSPIMCPLFLDPSTLVPALRYLRWLFPAYWLWPAESAPVPACLLGVLALTASVAVLAFVSNRAGARGRRPV